MKGKMMTAMALPTASEGNKMEIEVNEISDIKKIQGRIILDYADSGDGKSSRAHSFARYYFAKSGGKKVRLVAVEDSTRNVFQDLIDSGIVEAIFMTDSKSPLTTLERILVDGDWPLVGEFETKTDTKGNIKKVQKWQKKDEWDGEVSAYIIEGLTTSCELILNYLTETGRFPREQSDGFTEGGKTYMASSQTSFGFTQQEGIKLLKNSGMLPVDRVLWTAHEAKGKDEFGAESAVRGPKLVGSAATDTVRKYVGVLLHADRVKNKAGKEEVRVYVTNHPDPKNPSVSWKSKVTITPTKTKEFTAKYPDGYFVPTLPEDDNYTGDDGLIPFLKLTDELERTATNAANKFKQAILANN